MHDYGSLLRRRREDLRLTQTALAAHLGVSQGMISYWEARSGALPEAAERKLRRLEDEALAAGNSPTWTLVWARATPEERDLLELWRRGRLGPYLGVNLQLAHGVAPQDARTPAELPAHSVVCVLGAEECEAAEAAGKLVVDLSDRRWIRFIPPDESQFCKYAIEHLDKADELMAKGAIVRAVEQSAIGLHEALAEACKELFGAFGFLAKESLKEPADPRARPRARIALDTSQRLEIAQLFSILGEDYVAFCLLQRRVTGFPYVTADREIDFRFVREDLAQDEAARVLSYCRELVATIRKFLTEFDERGDEPFLPPKPAK